MTKIAEMNKVSINLQTAPSGPIITHPKNLQEWYQTRNQEKGGGGQGNERIPNIGSRTWKPKTETTTKNEAREREENAYLVPGS